MVEYFKIEAVPDKEYFRCDRYAATLSVDACAKMWRAANTGGESEQHFKCRICPIGAVHAGETAASMSPFKGTTICARCHRTAPRLIRHMICVSCYNREREYVLGKNAKGSVPIKLRALGRRRIFFKSGNHPETMQLELSAATDELIVATLRDNNNRVQFAFRGDTRGVPMQLRLW